MKQAVVQDERDSTGIDGNQPKTKGTEQCRRSAVSGHGKVRCQPWVKAVVLLRHCEELIGVHTQRIRPILTVDGEFHQQIHEPPDVVQYAREHEVEVQ